MVVLAGELLREAEQLVLQKIHPMTVIAGQLVLAVVAYASTLTVDVCIRPYHHTLLQP